MIQLDLPNGASVAKKYSNPAFFMEEFIREQEKELEELKLERKKRKRERLAQKRMP